MRSSAAIVSAISRGSPSSFGISAVEIRRAARRSSSLRRASIDSGDIRILHGIRIQEGCPKARGAPATMADLRNRRRWRSTCAKAAAAAQVWRLANAGALLGSFARAGAALAAVLWAAIVQGGTMRLARDSLTVGERIEILGTVQGVGFRPWVFGVARQMGIAGRVRNDPAGVVIEAFGESGSLERFRETLREAPSPARIQTLRYRPIPAEATDGFSIAPSTAAAPRRVSIPPDLAICSRCAAEIADPGDRRFIYQFTNCTACGPRFTIATDVPYDRASTTMAPFHLCGECAREYADPSDRRFHAEPNGCPRCGPRLSALDVTGREIVTGPIAEAALAIREGAIVAVKGIGGFHLACDASSPQAVLRLRERKRREEKPFAVMVRDLQEARRIAWLGPEGERLLSSPEAPIVLARRRAGSGIAAEVAPRNPLIGVLLPYAPLHRLLLAAVDRPLVMTSGNLSEEPIASRNDEALERLREIADLFLLHARDIDTRCDDSVAKVVAGKPLVLRRSRGYEPRPIPLIRPVRRPVLAVGGHLKNTFCL